MEILGGCLALLLLITIAVLAIMVLRKLRRPSPETIAEERATAEKQAKVIIQMVEDDDWPFPRWQVIRAYETCNWLKDHPDRRLPKHLRCSLSEYEDMLRKEQEKRLDSGDITGWKVADRDFDTW